MYGPYSHEAISNNTFSFYMTLSYGMALHPAVPGPRRSWSLSIKPSPGPVSFMTLSYGMALRPAVPDDT
jgi:hypothetical protein